MSTLSQFLQKSGPWIATPRHFPHKEAEVFIKDATTTSVQSNNDSFFTGACNVAGAYATVTGDDTYVTIANISGTGGWLGGVISPQTNGSKLATIRLTIDGVQYTYSKTVSSIRYAMGFFTAAKQTSNTATNVPAPNGYDSYYNAAFDTMILTKDALSAGIPVLRFESSCLVEAKVQTRIGTNPGDRCGALYLLD